MPSAEMTCCGKVVGAPPVPRRGVGSDTAMGLAAPHPVKPQGTATAIQSSYYRETCISQWTGMIRGTLYGCCEARYDRYDVALLHRLAHDQHLRQAHSLVKLGGLHPWTRHS